ncbi:MAG: DAK2 domain-containing protein [Bacillaceae bacterium]
MSIQQVDGKIFAQMIIEGANNLTKNVKMVDALNVFPVPDGDTGTNMNLSITSGAKEVRNNIQDHIGKVGISFSRGLLMGARGNSGVILSQLFRGFSKAIEGKANISTVEFADALDAGVKTAYKAVMKPIEGTILTVARESAAAAIEIAKNETEFVSFMEKVIQAADVSLENTPNLLPVLKEVGVVDSGGKGLVCVYEGFLVALKGGKVELENAVSFEEKKEEHHAPAANAQSHLRTEDIVYGYCTEFMVKFDNEKLKKTPFSEPKFREEISVFGDSLLVVADDELVKVHIHAEYPGEVLSYGQRYGSLINMKIENMREQHSNLLFEETEEKPQEKQPYGIVTVSMGDGIRNLFKSVGASQVIEGGQTMNPSTEDIVKAIEQANAEKVIVLPNNGNIIMAAEQAATVSDIDVVVIPTKSVPQGLAALLAFNPSASLEENKEGMTDAISTVKSGSVTFAVRDTNIDGVEINKDDFMGIFEKKIVATNKDRLEASKQLLEEMLDEDAEILTIIYGEDTTEEEVEALVAFVEDKYEDVEVEVHDGNQPLYSYIFSIE